MIFFITNNHIFVSIASYHRPVTLSAGQKEDLVDGTCNVTLHALAGTRFRGQLHSPKDITTTQT